MNATDEKSRLPIPDDCRRCMHCETWITRGVERNQCLRGHTLQPGCGWMRERTASVGGEGVSEKRIFRLVHDQARNGAAQFARQAPDGWVVTFSEPTRSLDQNAKFHAICSDVERSGAKWMNKPLTAQQWKVLFVSGHAVATGAGSEVVPGLEGEFVNIRESTARMSKKRGSSLIEYVLAWCAENEILLPSYGGDFDASYVQDELRGAGVREADRPSFCADRR